ncbi:MAG: hypothetical protein R2911_21715 [Caldilineaceae bacterium]
MVALWQPGGSEYVGTALDGASPLGNRGGGILIGRDAPESVVIGNIVQYNDGNPIVFSIHDQVEGNTLRITPTIMPRCWVVRCATKAPCGQSRVN